MIFIVRGFETKKNPNSYCLSEGRSRWDKKVQIKGKKVPLGTRGFSFVVFFGKLKTLHTKTF